MKIKLKDYLKISTNKIYESRHWNYRKKIKDNYTLWFLEYRNKIPSFDYKVNLDFKFYFKGRGYDSDNLGFMVKCMIDCLVKNKLLKDDTRKYVGRVSMESLKGEEDFCELTISKYDE